MRWASDPGIGRVELWTGDGDFLKVQEVIDQTWCDVAVVFRSFEVGTAVAIRRLGDGWEPIGPQYLQRDETHFVTRDEGQIETGEEETR